MQETLLKDLKKNIEKSKDRQGKKIIKSFIEENYQEGI